MFTGIIESLATVTQVETEGSNRTFTLNASLAPELKVDQSLAHDGVCLTVTAVQGNTYTVTAVEETLRRTTLGNWKPGTVVNLERCLAVGGRLDGHLVQGHVDLAGVCTRRTDRGGSWEFAFAYDEKSGHLTVEKGSICVNGVSLTVVDSGPGTFSVAIIPYTYEHTGFGRLQPGDPVNLEFDILGKYLQKLVRGYGYGQPS